MGIEIRGSRATKVRSVWLLSLVCLLLLPGCVVPNSTPGSVDLVTPQPSSPSLLAQTAIPSPGFTLVPNDPTAFPSATPPATSTVLPPTQVAHDQIPTQYDINVIMDYQGHSLSVNETISYVNLTEDNLADLILVIEPNLNPSGFTLNSLTWDNGETIGTYSIDLNKMQITLDQPLLPGEQLGLKVNYQMELPMLTEISSTIRPVAYGYSDRQTNLADWYPYIPPYINGQGWLVHQPWVLGEYQVYDVADFTVTLTLTEAVPDLVIAASAPALQEGDRYSYHLEAARTFVFSLSTEYNVQTTTVGDVTIYSYTFPFDKSAGQQVLDDTASAVQLFSQLFLPYSRPTFSIVEADFLDGMEYEGLSFLSHGFYGLYDGTPKGYLTFIAAHETAHQWWYGLVGNDQALEPWLDEALCTYMERIFYEKIYPDYHVDSGGSLVDWWWYYRVNFYDPVGWVDSTIYDVNNMRSYRDSVYLNGAHFMEDLRNLIGDEAFFAFLRDYAITNDHKIATAKDFFSLLRTHTSQDLDSLINTYFQSSR